MLFLNHQFKQLNVIQIHVYFFYLYLILFILIINIKLNIYKMILVFNFRHAANDMQSHPSLVS